MERTHVSIESLVDRINHNEIKLPEIQRAYVWKPHQVAHLFDSLYRGYPSGAMLLWRPKQLVAQRPMKVKGEGLAPVGSPAYLLDGQQRLTSLHRVYSADPETKVVFNVAKERFQIESAATAKDPHWISVADVLKADKLGPIRKALLDAVPDLDEDEVEDRIARVRKIAQYEYYLEILSDLPYEEVTQIFVRVNSGGRALKTVDLAMATLSAGWPGVVAKVEKEIDRWNSSWPKIDTAFLVRALAATATSTAALPALRGLTPEQLDAGWKRVRFGVEYAVKVLKENAGIHTSNLIPSINALVPLVVLLGSQEDKFDDADALIYWLLGAFVTGRYSAAADTKIAQDSLAARSPDALRGMFKSAGLLGAPLKVASEQLIGKGAGSPFFLLSYLAAKRKGAEDWWYGVKISESSGGVTPFAIEYHHVHPRTTLTGTYTKAEINDLSNLAFISARANKKIGGRSPDDYFPELCDDHQDQLSPHMVPLDPILRTADRYLDFVTARRELLASEMTSILDDYRPLWVATPAQPSVGQVERSVSLTIMSEPSSGPTLVFAAALDQEHYTATSKLAEFERFLRDMQENLASSVDVGPMVASVEPEQEDLRVAVGPFDIVGSLDDWEAVLAREKGDVTPDAGPPKDTPAFVGDRQEFSVVDTE